MLTESNRFSFFSAALSLISTYVVSSIAIPLYGLYHTENQVSYLQLSLSSVVYFIGAVSALLLFGRVSNFIGRKTSSLLALLIAALSIVFFLHLDSALPLIIGRLLQGTACGLASTALTSWLVDHAKAVPNWVPSAVISCGPMTGLTIGGIGSGLLVEYAPMPRQFGFYLALGLVILCSGLLFRSQETMVKKSGVLRCLKPNFTLPPSARRAFPVAACTFVATWALGGFFQAFGPAMAHEQLHSDSAVAAALVFASIMAPSSLGAWRAGKMSGEKAQWLGMISFTLAVGGVLVALSVSMLSAFMITSVLAGIAQGMVLTGSISTMVTGLEAEQRPSVFSVIYAVSYVGAALPTLIAGRLSEQLSLLHIAAGYGVLAFIATLVVLLSKIRATSLQSSK
ncbi:Predicted arabinose efflux permease, MFS family [Vibrio xiamenensis]|uniref:Predicted arabinose efflux permease, MFS family n=1 Tax=Vibrio xiamenensis TaxID=861298 RepID=A0A1G8AQZ5_9VIBR|nr:MFS transporter [Vibrio xiamenensis]SDH23303.1 Predicted arabinose efflux permease, MFS family [Vibrio xiamenensis]